MGIGVGGLRRGDLLPEAEVLAEVGAQEAQGAGVGEVEAQGSARAMPRPRPRERASAAHAATRGVRAAPRRWTRPSGRAAP